MPMHYYLNALSDRVLLWGADRLTEVAWLLRRRTLKCDADLDEGSCLRTPTRIVDDGSECFRYFCQICLMDGTNTTLTYPDRDAGWIYGRTD